MSEQNAPEPTSEPTTTPEAPVSTGIDPAISSRLDELSANIAKLVPQDPQHGFSEAIQQPVYDPYEEQDLFETDGEYDEYGQPQGIDPNQLQQFIAQQVQQAVSPFVQNYQQDRIHQQATQLEQRYPELAKPEVAGPVVQQAQQLAAQIGRNNGMSPQQIDAMWRDPTFVENLYLAQRARTAAAQETPADATSNVQLEGSAAQAEADGTDDVMSRIANAGNQPTAFRW